LRDKTIFELLYSSGLRISEAVELKLSDIDFSNQFLTVIGKGNKQRMVPIGKEAMRLINKYLSESRNVILNGREAEFLFISKKGSKLNRKSVWRLLKNYVNRVDIDKNITPHTLRHSFASSIEKWCSFASVRRCLAIWIFHNQVLLIWQRGVTDACTKVSS
jgi:integrase/recombinase XerD